MGWKNTLWKTEIVHQVLKMHIRTHQHYGAPNEFHPRLILKNILEMHLRVFLTNILSVDQPGGYSGDASSEDWGGILKCMWPFACLIFSEMHLWYNLIKHWSAWSQNHTCSPLQNPYQKPFYSQSIFSLQIFYLVFHDIKGREKVGIPGKDHLFQASFLTLILFSVCETYIYSGDTFSKRIWTHPEMHFWYLSVFIFQLCLQNLNLLSVLL